MTVDISVPIPGHGSPKLLSVFGWIIVHQRNGDDYDWNRGWGHYRNGFGAIAANFWLGLKRMNALTGSQPYRLRVELQTESGVGRNEWYSAEYWSFAVGDEVDEKFRLYVAGYSGDAGDKLSHHSGMSFTTKDRDNDQQNESNCAKDLRGGWWFKSCHFVCLTCLSTEYRWCSMPGGEQLIVSRMMIKPQ